MELHSRFAKLVVNSLVTWALTCSDHEPKQDELGRGSNHEHDLEGQPVVKSGVFDGQGQDEASEEHEVGRLQVVDAHFGLKKVYFASNWAY